MASVSSPLKALSFSLQRGHTYGIQFTVLRTSNMQVACCLGIKEARLLSQYCYEIGRFRWKLQSRTQLPSSKPHSFPWQGPRRNATFEPCSCSCLEL